MTSIAKRYGFNAIQSDDVFYGKGLRGEFLRKKSLLNILYERHSFLHDLEEKLEAELKENQQLELYYDLEMPLAFILADMESQGVKVDIERLTVHGRRT